MSRVPAIRRRLRSADPNASHTRIGINANVAYRLWVNSSDAGVIIGGAVVLICSAAEVDPVEGSVTEVGVN